MSSANVPRLGSTHIITSVRGRPRRPIKNQYSNKKFLDSGQMVNHPIQATCSDFLKGSLRVLYMLIQSGVLPAHIVLTAHDEIVFECALSDQVFVSEML